MQKLSRRKSLIFLFIGVLFVPFKANAKGLATFKFSKLHIEAKSGKYEFNVEMAITNRQLEQGLMYRRSLPSNYGMLFDYKVPRNITMWMKNTFIPLDMIFIGANGRVVNIVERTIPRSLAVISSNGRARAVLEVNSGTVSRLGIKPGDKVEHKIFSNSD